MANVDQKDLYAQTGELCRHYLSWREKLFAGYLVVIAGLAVAVKDPRDPEYFRSAIAILGAILTIVFWLLESRNRALFYECVKTGSELELTAPELAASVGPFTRLNQLGGTLQAPTHSKVLSCFFAFAIVALLAIARYFWPR